MSRRTPDPAVPLLPSLTGLSPSAAGLPRTIPLAFVVTYAVHTPGRTRPGLGSSAFARRYSRNRCFFLFLRLLRCFSSPGSLLYAMYSHIGDRIAPAGFPHSDIHGSQPMCGSPWLFAACRVLLRLPVPRHPPCALLILVTISPSCEYDGSPPRTEVSPHGLTEGVTYAPAYMTARSRMSCAWISFKIISSFLCVKFSRYGKTYLYIISGFHQVLPEKIPAATYSPMPSPA